MSFLDCRQICSCIMVINPKIQRGLFSPPLASVRLNLHLSKTVLPDGDVRSGTVLAVVEEDDPERISC